MKDFFIPLFSRFRDVAGPTPRLALGSADRAAEEQGAPVRVGRPDPRMISGAVISNAIFLDVRDISVEGGDLRARLVASPRHEIWLESTGAPLQSLAGRLHIVDPVAGAERPAQLTRDGDGFCVDLSLSREERARLGASLTLFFDVEYAEGYESPGGYSAAYGVRYWDDVAYPVVDVDRVEFG